MSDSKNDIHWQKLFEKYSIVKRVSDDGHFYINALEINEFREARLMTKFDHKSQLPKLFVENNLSILPVSRGSYIIAEIETFHLFPDNDDSDVIKIDFPNHLESIDYKDITSESSAINCAFVTGILQDFLDDDQLIPTVNGRMSSQYFDFTINSNNGSIKNIKVENSQIEIDGGYEGTNALHIIEAKNYISKDFLIRQLYYPYRLWKNKIRKHVATIFLTYTNGIFHLREFVFSELNHYNSLEIVKQTKYTIRAGVINFEAIQKNAK